MTIEDYEKYRLASLHEICEEKDVMIKIELFENAAEKLIEAGKYFGFRGFYDVAHETVIKLDIVIRMLKDGKLCAKDIAYYLGAELGDVYGMAEKLGIDMQPTEEETEIIRKEKQEKTYRLEMTEDGEMVIKPNFE